MMRRRRVTVHNLPAQNSPRASKSVAGPREQFGQALNNAFKSDILVEVELCESLQDLDKRKHEHPLKPLLGSCKSFCWSWNGSKQQWKD